MEKVTKYFNKQETEVINSIKQNITRIKREQYMLYNDDSLRHKKYLNNLFRQIDYHKDDLYALEAERITEIMFYEKKYINEANINNLNKDVLQIINEFDSKGVYYLFYKQTDEDFYHISHDIDSITTLIKEGWIQRMYKGKYDKQMTIDDLKNCELVFHKKSMKFKKINLLDIRKQSDVYLLTTTTEKNGKEDITNHIIRDIDDYYNVEDHIVDNDLYLKSINLSSIDDISEEHIYTSFEMSIKRATLYNKVYIKNIRIEDCMVNTLHDKINRFMNKDKIQNIE